MTNSVLKRLLHLITRTRRTGTHLKLLSCVSLPTLLTRSRNLRSRSQLLVPWRMLHIRTTYRCSRVTKRMCRQTHRWEALLLGTSRPSASVWTASLRTWNSPSTAQVMLVPSLCLIPKRSIPLLTRDQPIRILSLLFRITMVTTLWFSFHHRALTILSLWVRSYRTARARQTLLSKPSHRGRWIRLLTKQSLSEVPDLRVILLVWIELMPHRVQPFSKSKWTQPPRSIITWPSMCQEQHPLMPSIFLQLFKIIMPCRLWMWVDQLIGKY